MENTIKESRDFRRLYHKGKSLVSRAVVVYYLPNRRRETRLGLTCGKKIGGAVARNRAKRVLRAAFRAVAPSIAGHYDFILVARTATPGKKSTEVARALEALLREAGLLRRDAPDGAQAAGAVQPRARLDRAPAGSHGAPRGGADKPAGKGRPQ